MPPKENQGECPGHVHHMEVTGVFFPHTEARITLPFFPVVCRGVKAPFVFIWAMQLSSSPLVQLRMLAVL